VRGVGTGKALLQQYRTNEDNRLFKEVFNSFLLCGKQVCGYP